MSRWGFEVGDWVRTKREIHAGPKDDDEELVLLPKGTEGRVIEVEPDKYQGDYTVKVDFGIAEEWAHFTQDIEKIEDEADSSRKTQALTTEEADFVAKAVLARIDLKTIKQALTLMREGV